MQRSCTGKIFVRLTDTIDGMIFARQFVFQEAGYNLDWLEGEMIFKMPEQEYTAEFKDLAVTRVRSGHCLGAVAKKPGLAEQTLRNWVKAAKAGKLHTPG